MLTQVGTYFWHAHSKSLRAEGMTGALIIENPAEDFQYDEERTLMLTDWWHEQVRVLAAGLAQKTFRWVGDPASVLINGQGCFAKAVSKTQCNVNITCPSIARTYVIDVEPGCPYLAWSYSTNDTIPFRVQGRRTGFG